MAAILKVPKVPICKPPVYEVDSMASSITKSKSRFLPSRTSSKANLQTSKICILQSISPWNTALPSISSLKASSKRNRKKVPQKPQSPKVNIAHRVKPHNASGGQSKPIMCKFTRRLARERVIVLRKEVNKISPTRAEL